MGIYLEYCTALLFQELFVEDYMLARVINLNIFYPKTLFVLIPLPFGYHYWQTHEAMQGSGSGQVGSGLAMLHVKQNDAIIRQNDIGFCQKFNEAEKQILIF